MMLGFLDIDHELVPVNWATGEHKSESYMVVNPRAQIPAIDDAGAVIWDSQAILAYLARRYDTSGQWFPEDPLTLTRVMQWLMLANEEIAALAWARVTVVMKKPRDGLAVLQNKGRTGIAILNSALAEIQWLAGTDNPTIGDVACFPYTGMAEQGEISLKDFSHVDRSIADIKALPRYTPMPGL